VDLLRHETQVPKAGDYYTCRSAASRCSWSRQGRPINVLYNAVRTALDDVRRPQRQRGRILPLLLPLLDLPHDGTLKNIPMMESGYAGTRWGATTPTAT